MGSGRRWPARQRRATLGGRRGKSTSPKEPSSLSAALVTSRAPRRAPARPAARVRVWTCIAGISPRARRGRSPLKPMPRRIARCLSGGTGGRARSSRPGAPAWPQPRSVENRLFRPSVMRGDHAGIGAPQAVVAHQHLGVPEIATGACRLDQQLGERRDVAHGEIEALRMDRMDAMRRIADERDPGRDEPPGAADAERMARGLAGDLEGAEHVARALRPASRPGQPAGPASRCRAQARSPRPR